jgi:PAS domain-containing protein
MVEVDADVRWVSEQAGAQSCHGLAFAAPAQSLFGRLEPLLRRHLYLKLEANLSRYASYFEALPEAVLCLDGADTIVAANARARDALGAETLDGVHVLDVVDDGSKTALIEALGSVRRHACQIRCELALRSQAHAPREAALGPLPGAGDGGGVILTCRDAIEAEEDPG